MTPTAAITEVIFKKDITILARSYFAILVKYNNLSSNDYIFKLLNNYSIILYAILVNSVFYTILAYNNIN